MKETSGEAHMQREEAEGIETWNKGFPSVSVIVETHLEQGIGRSTPTTSLHKWGLKWGVSRHLTRMTLEVSFFFCRRRLSHFRLQKKIIMGSRVWISVVFFSLLLVSNCVKGSEEQEVEHPSPPSHVLTLDASNFEETIAKHPFVVVEFYAPWCGHCQKLEPEYEKAASDLSKHDPPIVLAKVDANEEANKGLASKYDVSGFPTIKILRNKGESVEEYNGPREADGIVQYLKKQAGPASAVITSSEDADNIIDLKKVFIVGVFPEFSGKEFDNFIMVAEKMRSDYAFAHTMDAKFLPKGESIVKGPIVRLLKPFDELFVDFQEFHGDSLEKFIKDTSLPLVTVYNSDPNNHPFVIKFFNSAVTKALLFVNFTDGHFEEFKSKYSDVAEFYKKGKDFGFLMGDLDISQGAFQYFGLKEEQAPLIVLQTTDSQKYLKANIKPLEIAVWLKEYTDGNVKPYRNSEPIPEVNNEPVKVVVGDSVHDIVFNSGKNVLLEFYAPWCGHCQKLAPILEEVAVSFESDPDVVIAKLDATANDFPKEFEVQGYPTMYFSSASGKLVQHDGGRTKEDIIDFINQNKDALESEKVDSESESVKDEL